MIIKGKARGSAQQLGSYLTKQGDNDRVELHSLRGFIADDVKGAMREADAIAKGSRCSQHLFSIALNPPPHESVRVEVFETALAKIEERMGLGGQPSEPQPTPLQLAPVERIEPAQPPQVGKPVPPRSPEIER